MCPVVAGLTDLDDEDVVLCEPGGRRVLVDLGDHQGCSDVVPGTSGRQ
jgi:hypothetical protein